MGDSFSAMTVFSLLFSFMSLISTLELGHIALFDSSEYAKMLRFCCQYSWSVLLMIHTLRT